MRKRASDMPSSWAGTSDGQRESPTTTCAMRAEADEAVQDAFVKAYSHLSTFREELPFEVWFTRILINGCLDRIKARTRRENVDRRDARRRRRANAIMPSATRGPRTVA